MSQRFFATIFLFCGAANFAYSQNGTSVFQPNIKPALEIRRTAGAVQIDGE